MDVSIIICTYNRSEHLKQLINSLKTLVIPDQMTWEILIVDNNSTDNTKSLVTEFQQKGILPLKYVFEKQQGKAFALNTGVESAKGDVIVFTDDDVTVDQYWILRIKEAFDRFDCMGVGGRIVAVWSCEKPSWFNTDGPYGLMAAIVSYDLGEETREIETPSHAPYGPNLAVKRIAFEKYGLFRTDLDRTEQNLMGAGDTEFGRRLINGKEKFVYEPKAIVYHPVEEQRAEKEFFQAWYFDYGRTIVRMSTVPKNAICYFGIPRYSFRKFPEAFVKWFFTINQKRRFYYKLQLFQMAGEITEFYNSSKRSQERARSLYGARRW